MSSSAPMYSNPSQEHNGSSGEPHNQIAPGVSTGHEPTPQHLHSSPSFSASYSLPPSPMSWTVPATSDVYGMGAESSTAHHIEANNEMQEHDDGIFHPYHQTHQSYSVPSTPSSWTLPSTPVSHSSAIPALHLYYPAMRLNSKYSAAYQTSQHGHRSQYEYGSGSSTTQQDVYQQHLTRLSAGAQNVRPDRLSEYNWQMQLNVDTVLQVYEAVVPHWPLASKTAHMNMFERLNAFLDRNPHLVSSILSNEKDIIKAAADFSSPIFTKEGSNPQTLEEFYSWIRSPISRSGRSPTWALPGLDIMMQCDLVEVLHRAWMKDRECVKKRLKRMGVEEVIEWADKVLDQDKTKSYVAASQWEHSFEQRMELKKLEARRKSAATRVIRNMGRKKDRSRKGSTSHDASKQAQHPPQYTNHQLDEASPTHHHRHQEMSDEEFEQLLWEGQDD